MEEETSVEVEKTTEESQPEANLEEAEASEEQSEDTSSEGTENTAEVESKAPRTSRANERIRELIAQKKELEAQLSVKPQEPNIEGVDETGIDPNRFAESVLRQAEQKADQRYIFNRAIDEATRRFPEVAKNDLVGTRATALMSEGYDPIQAAEIATLEWREQLEMVNRKSTQRQNAGARMRQGASMSSAGQSGSTSGSDHFTRSEIAKMTPDEYEKNAKAIQSQLEKYGAESFEE